MKIGEFVARLQSECARQGMPAPLVDQLGLGVVKLRIRWKKHIHISVYYNEETGTLTSALVKNSRRVFGYDAYPSQRRWHIHPVGKTEIHEEAGELSVEEIVSLYAKIIENMEC